MPRSTCGGQRDTLRSQFSSPSFTWVPELELRSSGAAGASLVVPSCWTPGFLFVFDTESHVLEAGFELTV